MSTKRGTDIYAGLGRISGARRVTSSAKPEGDQGRASVMAAIRHLKRRDGLGRRPWRFFEHFSARTCFVATKRMAKRGVAPPMVASIYSLVGFRHLLPDLHPYLAHITASACQRIAAGRHRARRPRGRCRPWFSWCRSAPQANAGRGVRQTACSSGISAAKACRIRAERVGAGWMG